MKKIFFLYLLLYTQPGYTQLKSVVIDSLSKAKIPYVNIWVENENTGTTSNLEGAFELALEKPKILIFSAIGFQTKRISSENIGNFVALQPAGIELAEVMVSAKKQQKRQELKIGTFKKKEINAYFACSSTPWIVARYFAYEEAYAQSPFLKSIKVLTQSRIGNARFNIRIYRKNSEGAPEGYLYDKNIIGIAKKGKTFTELDISDLHLVFPKEGLFIAIEWLIIDENKYEYKYVTEDSNILKPKWFCIKKKIKSLKIKIINQENPENHFNLGIKNLTVFFMSHVSVVFL
jgi:hypothetical protein